MPDPSDPLDFLVVGRVERPHGLTGELSVSIATDFPERFAPGLALAWRRGSESRALRVAEVRPHGRRLLLRVEGVADADAARALAGGELCVAREDAHPAPVGYYYEHQLEGFVCEDASGRRLGEAVGLEQTAAGPLLSVATGAGRTALVPFVEGIVVRVEPDRRRIVLDPPEGLMDLA